MFRKLNAVAVIPARILPDPRYARPGVDAVARHVAERDPAARRQH
ncbi:hypothetical protein [Actinacidiphila soli]|nr:hypothetical protein [Actinacidiphila soli]